MAAPLPHVVVVLPGIMGSVLEDRDGKDVWKLSKASILKGIFTRGRAIKALRLPDGIGDEAATDGVRATALMPDLHVIPGIWSVNVGYERLVSWLRSTFDLSDGSDGRPANLVLFPYDWRLSNRYNAGVLQRAVEPALERFRATAGQEDAKLVFVTHSMGGLVARYFTDVLGGHEITAKLITLGTPHRGALNALESLINGVRKGFGPLGIDLTELSRSLPALYQLLPEYACIEQAGELVKTTELTLPELGTAMVADAMRFHDELSEGAARVGDRYDSHAILARTQPTSTTAKLVGGRVEPLRALLGDDQKGDGTVPRLSAAPYGIASDSPTLRYVMDKHGALPMNDAVLVECEGVLTGRSSIPRALNLVDLGVSAPDVLLAGEVLDVSAETEDGIELDADVADVARASQTVASAAVEPAGDGTYRAAFDFLAPGAYELRVRVRGGAALDQVTTPLVVLDPAALSTEA